MSKSTLDEFLSSYTPELRDLVMKTRALVLEIIPDAIEQVDPPSKIVAYGLGLKYKDLICAIAPYKTDLNLIFSKGTELPDPEGLLTGTGKRARHVKIRTAEAIQAPGLRKLLEAAVSARFIERSTTVEDAMRLLGRLVGEWEGISRTWFEPEKLADESPNHATIRLFRGGRFVLHEYESVISGEPLHGMAIYGYNLNTRLFQVAWADSFHMNTNLMISEGPGSGNGFSVLGSYADPSGGPPWGWRTQIEIVDPDHITITAYNITPQGEEAKAVETTYTRIPRKK